MFLSNEIFKLCFSLPDIVIDLDKQYQSLYFLAEPYNYRKGYFPLFSPKNQFLDDFPSLIVDLIITVDPTDELINTQIHNIDTKFVTQLLEDMNTISRHGLLSEFKNEMLSFALIIIKLEQQRIHNVHTYEFRCDKLIKFIVIDNFFECGQQIVISRRTHAPSFSTHRKNIL